MSEGKGKMDIQSDAKILEDGDDALVDAAADSTETVEYADLNELDKPAPAAPVAATKPAPAAPAAPAAPNLPVTDDDVPEQFRGKSKKDIVKMYQEAHQTIGRQGSELGELRQKTDFAIKASLEALRARKAEDKPAAPAAEPMDESAFFAKPHESVSKAIESHPIIQEIRRTLGRAAADQATARAAGATEQFNRAHPDAQEVMRDVEFRQWVNASPIRRALMDRANKAYDFHAGDEVFSTWKALRGVKQSQSAPAQSAPAATGAPDAAAVSAAAATLANARKAKADAAAKAATVPTGAAAGAGKPTAGKKIYRRADVLRLMEEQPERYEAMADELSLAYAENRVR
jgi:hypothetical protein